VDHTSTYCCTVRGAPHNDHIEITMINTPKWVMRFASNAACRLRAQNTELACGKAIVAKGREAQEGCVANRHGPRLQARGQASGAEGSERKLTRVASSRKSTRVLATLGATMAK
jgi:hypothetical protein